MYCAKSEKPIISESGLGIDLCLRFGMRDGTATNRDTNALSEIKKRLAVKSLILPGGLGSTQKVMVFGKNVGQPQLTGLSYQMRIT